MGNVLFYVHIYFIPKSGGTSFFALFFYMHLTASRCGFNIYPLQLRQVVEQDNKNFSSFDIASPRWFKENYLVIFAICTIIGWKVFGYNLIVMLAAMVAVPKEMIEAALNLSKTPATLKQLRCVWRQERFSICRTAIRALRWSLSMALTLTGAMCACLMQRAAKIWKNVINFRYRAKFAV